MTPTGTCRRGPAMKQKRPINQSIKVLVGPYPCTQATISQDPEVGGARQAQGAGGLTFDPNSRDPWRRRVQIALSVAPFKKKREVNETEP